MASLSHGVAASGTKYKLNATEKDMLEPLLANAETIYSSDDSGKFLEVTLARPCHFDAHYDTVA